MRVRTTEAEVAGPDGATPDGAVPDDAQVSALDAGKAMRIGIMVHNLLEEVRTLQLDEHGRARLLDAHRRTLEELAGALPKELVEELAHLGVHLDEPAPSTEELRMAQAQLVGWLEGLFQGVRMALALQQENARAQLDEIRRHSEQRKAAITGDTSYL